MINMRAKRPGYDTYTNLKENHNSIAVHIQKQDQFVCVCSIQKVNLKMKPKGKREPKSLHNIRLSCITLFSQNCCFYRANHKNRKKKKKGSSEILDMVGN